MNWSLVPLGMWTAGCFLVGYGIGVFRERRAAKNLLQMQRLRAQNYISLRLRSRERHPGPRDQFSNRG